MGLLIKATSQQENDVANSLRGYGGPIAWRTSLQRR